MSERAARARTPWRRTLVASLAFAALAGGVMLLRTQINGEAWHSRTQWLTGMAATGGFFGALFTLFCLDWIARGWTAKARALASAIGFAGFYLCGFGAAFVLHSRVISGQFEPHPERMFASAVFSSLQTVALYAISIPRYALWWMLPLLMLAAAILLPRVFPGRRS